MVLPEDFMVEKKNTIFLKVPSLNRHTSYHGGLARYTETHETS